MEPLVSPAPVVRHAGVAGRLAHVDVRRAVAGPAALVLLVAAGSAQGAYFPGSWGWLALPCAWLAGLALLLDERAALTRAGAVVLASALGLSVWTILSGLWSVDVTQTGLEAQRTLLYATALLALLTAGREAAGTVLVGVWGAIALLSGWGLLTRLLPERLGVNDAVSGYRLSQPLGYWNGLGLFAGMGALLALGLAARGRSAWVRALAGASIVPLALTLYFTFSRGAWVALAGGLLVALALDPQRLRLLATGAAAGAWAVAAVLLGSRSHALTTVGAVLADRSRQGHRLLEIALALTLAAGLSTLVAGRLHVGRRVARASGGLLVAAGAAGIAAVVVAYGAPWTIATHAWRSFADTPAAGTTNLNSRLFQLSGNGRIAQWRVATQEVDAHPWLGGGAGTYETYWDRLRPAPLVVRDVHNLYLETLAELGPVGLALLAALLLTPLALAVRARQRPLGAVAAGAFAAYLAHAIVDWDWELGAVTLAALACGAALVAPVGDQEPVLRGGLRLAAVALAAVLGAASVYMIAGRYELNREGAAAASGDWATAASAASRGAALQPWSAEPWQRLGEAELGAGRFAAARADLERALARDDGSWRLWLDLAQASNGRRRVQALAMTRRLDPRSPELAAYLATIRSISEIQTRETGT